MNSLIVAVMREEDSLTRGRPFKEISIGRSTMLYISSGQHIVSESNQRLYDSVLEILIGKECSHISLPFPGLGLTVFPGRSDLT